MKNHTSAVIMCGGDGGRLKPLTCSIPKAMLDICNIPLLDYNISSLERHGISDLIITADRFSNLMAEHFLQYKKPPLISVSKSPIGTAAALEKAVTESDLSDRDAILVINGASLSDFDYAEIIRTHKNNAHTVTLILKKSELPYEHITATENNGTVSDILTCQPRESCISDKILTGSFVISGIAAAGISKYGDDLYRDVFPAMIKSGLKIHAVTEEGYFAFLQTPSDLLKLNHDVLYKIYPHTPENISVYHDKDGNAFPICIGKNCDISSDVQLLDGCVIGDNTDISDGAKLKGAVVGKGVYIGRKCTINNAVIANSVRMAEGASVFENAVIGENAIISENAAVEPGVKIWNGRHIDPFSSVSYNVKYGTARPFSIGEDGITGETNGIITPQIVSAAGSAAASVGKRILVGCKDNNASYSLAMAFAAGGTAAGADIWFLGNSTEAETAYCAKICTADIACFIESGVSTRLRFVSGDGLPLKSTEERIIENGLNRNEYRRSDFMRFGKVFPCDEIGELYKGYIAQKLPKALHGIKVIINTPSKRISDICTELLRDINDKNGESTVFHIGEKASVYTESTGYIFYDKLVLLCCLRHFERGEDVSLPQSFPTAADKLAKRYGRTVLRYSCCSDGTDTAAREKCSDFASDGVALMAEVLSYMNESGMGIGELVKKLPEFASVNRFVALDKGRWGQLGILRELCSVSEPGQDGITINDKRGRVMIRPVKTGQGVMMNVESYNMETASELCDFYQDTLKAISKKGLLK